MLASLAGIVFVTYLCEKDNIAENTDIIINRWYELFKTDHEDNQ